MLAQESHLVPFVPYILLGLVVGCAVLAQIRDRRKILAMIGALGLASQASAAPIHIATPPPVPEDYLEVQIELTTLSFPRVYSVRDYTHGNTLADLEFYANIPYLSVQERLVEPFFVLKADPIFDFRQAGFEFDYLEIDLAAFVAAGDDAVTMLLDPSDSGTDPWNTIEWESPNLGMVQVTYEIIGQFVPEPSSWLLGVCGLLLFRKKTF